MEREKGGEEKDLLFIKIYVIIKVDTLFRRQPLTPIPKLAIAFLSEKPQSHLGGDNIDPFGFAGPATNVDARF